MNQDEINRFHADLPKEQYEQGFNMSDTPTENLYLIQDNPVQNRTVQFFKDGVQIGCFDFGASPATFKGDVDESARLFVDCVIKTFQAQTETNHE